MTSKVEPTKKQKKCHRRLSNGHMILTKETKHNKVILQQQKCIITKNNNKNNNTIDTENQY